MAAYNAPRSPFVCGEKNTANLQCGKDLVLNPAGSVKETVCCNLLKVGCVKRNCEDVRSTTSFSQQRMLQFKTVLSTY